MPSRLQADCARPVFGRRRDSLPWARRRNRRDCGTAQPCIRCRPRQAPRQPVRQGAYVGLAMLCRVLAALPQMSSVKELLNNQFKIVYNHCRASKIGTGSLTPFRFNLLHRLSLTRLGGFFLALLPRRSRSISSTQPPPVTQRPHHDGRGWKAMRTPWTRAHKPTDQDDGPCSRSSNSLR